MVREQKCLKNTFLNENSPGSKQNIQAVPACSFATYGNAKSLIHSDRLYLLIKETTVFPGKVTNRAAVCQWMWGAQNYDKTLL